MFKETEKTSEPDSDMARMLDLSDQEIFRTMINMIKALNGKKIDRI